MSASVYAAVETRSTKGYNSMITSLQVRGSGHQDVPHLHPETLGYVEYIKHLSSPPSLLPTNFLDALCAYLIVLVMAFSKTFLV